MSDEIVMGNIAELRAELAKYKALAVKRGRDLMGLEPTISGIVDEIEDEGDRVYFGSTNDADYLQELAHNLQSTGWEIEEPELLEPDYPKVNAELRAENERLRAKAEKLAEALRIIESHRRKCHEHDDDCGHFRRSFDAEDVRLMEWQARAALKELENTDD